MLTVPQALTRLSEFSITSSIQMVRRWLRKGVIQGERTENRKAGWRIPPNELERFIQSRNVTEHVHRLQAEVDRLTKQIAELQHHGGTDGYVTAGRVSVSHTTGSTVRVAADVSLEQAVEYPRSSAEACMESYLSNLVLEREERLADDLMEAAKASVFGKLYPNGEEHALVRVRPRFECPFTGQLFGSIDELVHAAISQFIGEFTAEEQHDAAPTGADIPHEEEELPYLTHISLNTGQVQRIYPGEVDKKLYAIMERVWKDSFKPGGGQLFGGYQFYNVHTGLATIGTVYDGKGIPVITATCSSCDDGTVWRGFQKSTDLPIVIQPNEPPQLPYVAVQREIGFMWNKKDAPWTEDFSKCFGWLVLKSEMLERGADHETLTISSTLQVDPAVDSM